MIKATYTTVNESLAKRAKENISYGDYKSGTATSTQNKYVDKIVEYAENLLKRNPTENEEKLEKVQYYIDKYSQKIAQAIDKDNEITTRCPSILITGGGNFPTKRKEKQNAASHAHWEKTKDLYNTDSSNYYYNKIRLVLTDSGAIKSDDVDAVEKIKAKIEKLQGMPDPYGNKSAEIRRLKQRLLVLSPEEVKQGVQITINGKEATYENIIEIFNSYKVKESVYESGSFYLSIPLEFHNGKRKYTEYISNKVDKKGEKISTYGNKENNYEPIWKDLDDRTKFYLVINKISGSGNKAVMYSILKDLDPEIIASKEKQKEKIENGESTDEAASINGEEVKIVRNLEATRLQIFFDGIPEAETRSKMKSNGFKWAPSIKAWQRLLNDNAEYALKKLIEN